MRRLLTAGLVGGALVLAAAGVTATGGDELLKDERHFAQQATRTYTGGQKGIQLSNMAVVGRTDLGGRGFNGDVWVHEQHAYVGHWGFPDWASGSKNRFCPEPPQSGVAVVDARDPAHPAMVATLQNPVGSSAEDVVVFTARSGAYAGRDIAVVGIQWCAGDRNDPAARRGLQLFDVTAPSAPVELGFWDSGCCTRGVHEFEVEYRADLKRTYVYATVPASRYPDAATASGYRDDDGDGDFRLVDITDPRRPVQVSSWGIQDAGGPFTAGQGCDADPNYGHGAEPSADGKLVFIAYWDSGFVALDVSKPTRPVYRGRTEYPPRADGDAHSAVYDDARRLLFAADEDFCPNSGPAIEKGWGYLRVYDYSSLGAPVQVGEYRTPNSLAIGDTGAGDFTIHNNVLVGTTLYSAWYSDGVRVIDVADPRNPREVGFFVPPAAQNPVKPPQRGVLSQAPQVWGVAVDERGLVYASDMSSGLWIVRRT